MVQCREEDVKTVDAALSKAQSKYKSTYGKEAPQLTLDREHFLPKGASTQAQEDDPDHESWCAAGGRCAQQDAAAPAGLASWTAYGMNPVGARTPGTTPHVM